MWNSPHLAGLISSGPLIGRANGGVFLCGCELRPGQVFLDLLSISKEEIFYAMRPEAPDKKSLLES